MSWARPPVQGDVPPRKKICQFEGFREQLEDEAASACAEWGAKMNDSELSCETTLANQVRETTGNAVPGCILNGTSTGTYECIALGVDEEAYTTLHKKMRTENCGNFSTHAKADSGIGCEINVEGECSIQQQHSNNSAVFTIRGMSDVGMWAEALQATPLD